MNDEDKRPFFYWDGDDCVTYLIEQLILKPCQGQRKRLRRYGTPGKFILTDNGTKHQVEFIIRGGNLYVHCESRESLKPMYRELKKAQKYLNPPQMPKQIIKPILPTSTFELIQTSVFDFYEAIDGLGTTNGFGNVGIILTGPPGVGKSETMRWLKETAYQKYHLLNVSTNFLLSEGSAFYAQKSN